MTINLENPDAIKGEFRSWDTYEWLMDVASGRPITAHPMSKAESPNLVQNLITKRDRLTQQQVAFRQASEETIMREYKNMLHAHHEFMDCLNEVHRHCFDSDLNPQKWEFK